MPVLKVMTYNIRHGEGNDGRVDLSRVAAVIKEVDADVVALQEVDVNWKRSGRQHQARVLGRECGLNCCFGANLVRGRARFGNALLSRLERLEFRNHLLSSTRENRGLLEAYYDYGGQTICMMALHLGLSAPERHQHLDYILRKLTRVRVPLVLGGDFNMKPDDKEIKRVTGLLIDCCQAVGRESYTFPSADPRARIDYIFCSPHWRIVDVAVVASAASDHLPLVAWLELE